MHHSTADAQWVFSREELEKSPSIAGGLSFKEEWDQRSKGVFFIYKVTRLLNHSMEIAASASVLFHRFYMRRSLQKHHPYDIAATCLFISTKINEARTKIKKVAYNCARTGLSDMSLCDTSKVVSNWELVILRNEPLVLEYICFDLEIHSTASIVLRFANQNKLPTNVLKIALALVNDSLHSPVPLLFDPQQIALSAIYLSTCISSQALSDFDIERKVSNFFLRNEQAPELGSHLYSASNNIPSLESLEECVLDIIKFFTNFATNVANKLA